MMRWTRGLLAGLALLLAGPAAATCQNDSFEGVAFTACRFDPKTTQMRLFHRDATGAVYGQFTALRRALAARCTALE